MKEEVVCDFTDLKLKEVLDSDNRVFPIEKMILIWGLIIIMTIVSLLRGSGNGKDSPIGVKRCDEVDWTLFWILQVICILFEIAGIYVVR